MKKKELKKKYLDRIGKLEWNIQKLEREDTWKGNKIEKLRKEKKGLIEKGLVDYAKIVDLTLENNRLKDKNKVLQHEYDSSRGLWCTDNEDILSPLMKEKFFQLGVKKECALKKVVEENKVVSTKEKLEDENEIVFYCTVVGNRVRHVEMPRKELDKYVERQIEINKES